MVGIRAIPAVDVVDVFGLDGIGPRGTGEVLCQSLLKELVMARALGIIPTHGVEQAAQPTTARVKFVFFRAAQSPMVPKPPLVSFEEALRAVKVCHRKA